MQQTLHGSGGFGMTARRAIQLALALGLAFGAAGASTIGCSGGVSGETSSGGSGGGTSSTTSSAATGGSDGGLECPAPGIIRSGVCEGKCTPDKCVAENSCVDNRCLLRCDSLRDCYAGVQSCVAVKEDDTQFDINVCRFNGRAPFGAGCPFGDECGGILACPDGGFCDPLQCGGNGAACQLNTVECNGDPNCRFGLCPDNTPCLVNACPVEQCKPMTCRTTGKGDADAYCTIDDCHSDAECGAGFTCAIKRDPHGICNTNPPKGDNDYCGKTAEPCIAEADFANNGATYFEGSLCLLRKGCVKRGQCDPCETDLDCSLFADQLCTQVGAEKVCTRGCFSNKDCDPDYECLTGRCIPRFGACVGTGQFCEPCRNDEDCGGKGTTMACRSLSGDQKGCFDESFPDTCTTSADCPTSPSGKHGYCLDENLGLSPGDSLYHHCYVPFNLTSYKTSCW
jgi:hypothetical protein